MNSVTDPVDEILSRLEGVKRTGNQWQAKCPAHEDSKASLSLKRGDDGRVLVHCFAGCCTKDICGALGITEAGLFASDNGHQIKPQIVATYDYRDEAGELLYQAVRYAPKDFKQRRPDGKGGWIWNLQGVRRVLYRLPELAAADQSALVFIAEGEKDVDRLVRAGMVATCNVGGAGKWKDEYAVWFKGRRVVVIADKDGAEKKRAGQRHARAVCASLHSIAADVKYLELPGEKVKDAHDWFAAGGTAEKLMELAEQTAVFDPQAAHDTAGAGDNGDEGNEGAERLNQAQLLVNLAANVELWHDGDTAYVTIQTDDHRENHPANGKSFRLWLSRRFWEAFKRAPGAQAMQDALGVLGGKALFEGPQRAVAVRLAEQDGAIYLDLADDKWQVVKVTPQGWELVNDPPVMFIRKRGMLPLPSPSRGGSVNELRRFINVKEDGDFVLIVAWLVAVLRGRGPYPIQTLYGEQGSCKSTAQKMLRALVDPNKSPLRCEPKEPRDLIITASNSLVVGFDNLSHIPSWLSDALCRLSTGGGFSTRELYTDADEMIFDATRPVMLNGITEVATRPDLLDRSVLITLTPIAEADRNPEDELWRDFNEARPRILGALLHAMVVGQANIDTVRLDRLPRMADFAKWVVACEPGLGWKPGVFMQAYLDNRAAANESAIEGSVIGPLVIRLVEADPDNSITRTAKELMAAVEGMLPEDKNGNAKLPAGWPKSARAFSGELRRIAPNLRAERINVTFGKHTRSGTPITLETTGETSSPSSPSSPASNGKDLGGDGQRDGHHGLLLPPSPASSPHNRCNDKGFEEGDGGDGEIPVHSGDSVLLRKVVEL